MFTVCAKRKDSKEKFAVAFTESHRSPCFSPSPRCKWRRRCCRVSASCHHPSPARAAAPADPGNLPSPTLLLYRTPSPASTRSEERHDNVLPQSDKIRESKKKNLSDSDQITSEYVRLRIQVHLLKMEKVLSPVLFVLLL